MDLGNMDLEKLPSSVLRSIADTIRQKYINNVDSDVQSITSGFLLEIKAILDKRAAPQPGPDDQRQDELK